LYLRESDATLSGNTVFSNTATGSGGGLYLRESDATLSGNTVVFNTATDHGGGVGFDSSPATLSGNTISVNGAKWGGGLFLIQSDAAFTNNVVVDNQASESGGGFYVKASSPRLLHTTIARNVSAEPAAASDGDRSGVYVIGIGSSLALTNTILVRHTVGITVSAGNTVTLKATLWGTATWANELDWGGGGTIITGAVVYNYWYEPVFVDPDAGDYHILPDSAAIDAGVEAGVRVDVDHEPRPYEAPDLGADEYWPPGVLEYVYLPVVLRESSQGSR
jgi:parallel beta-helix repeat protein